MKTSRANRLRNSVPTANLRTVLEIVAERGVDREDVLHGSGLSLKMLQDTALRVPARQAARIVRNAYLLTGDPGLGMEFGLRTKPTAHGPLGYAAMACGTLREALHLTARYMCLRQQDLSLSVREEGGQLIVIAADAHDMGAARRFIYEAMMIGLWHIAGFLLPQMKPHCEICFDWPEPAYAKAYRKRLPKVRYGAAAMQLRMPARFLSHPLPMAEPEALQRAVADCEREMTLLGGGPGRRQAPLPERVRAELRAGEGGYPNLLAVAQRLFVSERTLKRRLEELGTSFQVLLDEIRYRDAQKLLDNPDLDIQQVAAALGYTDPPSFTRAYRRWSGQTPSAARASNTIRRQS